MKHIQLNKFYNITNKFVNQNMKGKIERKERSKQNSITKWKRKRE